MAAVVVAMVGGLVSIVAEVTTTRADAQKSQQAASASAADIASTLALSLEHEQDLVISGASFFVTDPTATQAQFSQWMASERAFERYPELTAISEVTMVPPSQLADFTARQAGGAGGAAPVTITPPGLRPYYCLGTVWETRGSGAATFTPPGIDFCQTTYGAWLLGIRDNGQGAGFPYGTGRSATLGVAWPVYQGGVVPGTVDARRAAFIGWVAEQIDPQVAMAAAVQHHPHTAVQLRYGSGSTAVTFSSGSAPAGARATVVALAGGWHVTTWSVVVAPGVVGSGPALLRLVVGLLISLLLGLLIYLLGTSRSRAVQAVSESTAKLRHLALHDSLTGLPNRALILDRLDQMMARSRRDDTRVAALFLDLDNFKQINDTLGHNAGDALLTQVGRRLTGALRDQDTVGRLGGDEFVVLVEGASLLAGSGAVADRILEALTGPFDLEDGDEPVHISVSIGIAEGVRPNPEELLQDADIALYEAKATGKHRAVIFSSAMQEALDDRRHLEQDLHGALEADQFVVRYLPTTDLSTQEVTGVEAHLGWLHPTRGEVPPATFLPALESSGEIVPVGRWLLLTACSHGAAWQRQGRVLAVSVGVTAPEFAEEGFVDNVRAVLALTGFDPGLLIMTFAETALIPTRSSRDDDAAIARLLELKSVGVRIALGEFDSGASSLTYLQRYPFDILKVDRSLVAGIVDPAETTSLADTLAQLGRVFGVDVVVEGPGSPGEFEPPDTLEGDLLASITPIR